MRKFLIFFPIVFLISFLFFNANDVFAEGEVCHPCPAHAYWECTSGTCAGVINDWWCEPCCSGSCWIQSTTKCEDWTKCDASESHPGCWCEGKCLEKPENPRYYNNPTYTDNKNKNIGNKDILLPVKLDWDDVKGWGHGTNPSVWNTGPLTYRIKINNTQNSYPEVTNKSEYIPPSCTLRSSASHGWQTAACCTWDGQNCGPYSNWNLTTAAPPELVYPMDVDWIGPDRVTDVPIPIKFDWCSIDNAQSYVLNLYKDGELYYPVPIEKGTSTPLNSEFNSGTEIITKFSDYDWKVTACTNENGTKCGPECTDKQSGQDCGNYSQYWKLTTGDIGLPAPRIITPDDSNNLPAVNLSDFLSWEAVGIKGVLAYYYEIIKDGEIVFSSSTLGSVTAVSFKDFWNKLEFNQLYSWKIYSCWDEAGEKCEKTFNTSSFKTTGAPPTNLRIGPIDPRGEIVIPISIKSDPMPGTTVYYYEIAQNESFSSIVATGTTAASPAPETLVDYPNLKTKTNYWLKLKTCADNQGKVCGDPSNKTFTTFTFSLVSNPKPANGANLLTYEKQLAWDNVLGAKYYQYQVSDGLQEIVAATSTYLATEKLALGNHSWSIRPCLDQKCQEAGEWSNFTFNLVQTENCPKALVSCGRSCNSPDTPWNDRDPCQFKDIFQFFKNILDFVLWTLIPFVLVILAIYSGVIYYFSMADPNPMIKVKGLWKSFGKGCLIIFGAWFIISWLLLFIGFQVQIFGHWYQSPF